MRMPFRFFLPTQQVPEWLLEQVPWKEEDCFVPAGITFGDLCLVVGWKRAYHVISVTGIGPVFRLDGKGRQVTLRWGSPCANGRGVIIRFMPWHSWIFGIRRHFWKWKLRFWTWKLRMRNSRRRS